MCARLDGGEALEGRVASPAHGPGVTRDRYYRSDIMYLAEMASHNVIMMFQETSGCDCVPYEQCPTFLKVPVTHQI